MDANPDPPSAAPGCPGHTLVRANHNVSLKTEGGWLWSAKPHIVTRRRKYYPIPFESFVECSVGVVLRRANLVTIGLRPGRLSVPRKRIECVTRGKRSTSRRTPVQGSSFHPFDLGLEHSPQPPKPSTCQMTLLGATTAPDERTRTDDPTDPRPSEAPPRKRTTTHLVLHIREEPPDLRGEVDDVRGLKLLEYRVGLRPVPEVAVLGREEDPSLAREGVGVGVGLDGLAD